MTQAIPTPSASRPWLKHYPAGMPTEIDASKYENLTDLLSDSFKNFGDRDACVFMGKRFSYQLLNEQSKHLASYLQQTGIKPGDRVAVMMINVPQYMIAVGAILRIGAILVNVNPLYTPHELEHQLTDSKAKAIIVLENFAATVQACLGKVPLKQVVTTTIGDMLGLLKGSVVNFVLRKVRKQIPDFSITQAVTWESALAQGAKQEHTPYRNKPEDIAVLQYTGGTTGVSKGAALSHSNIVANVLQADAWNAPALKTIDGQAQFTTVVALPLYHIFAFTVSMLVTLRVGGLCILIPNPRDLEAMLKDLSKQPFHCIAAVNTLFNGLLNHADFDKVNWKSLKITLGGGMAVQSAVAQRWLERTGCPICEGYGLSETSPIASANPTDTKTFSATIGMPIPSTLMKIIAEDEQEMPLVAQTTADGKEVWLSGPGEIAIKGPQVMHGYWERPEETAKTMTADGYFKSGDIGVMDERGYFKIVDRKKDMVLVSGFNVYPNEVEEVVARMPGVLECAVVAVPDDKTGEAVKLFVVKKDPNLTEQAIRDFCHAELTGYKRPKYIEFRTELPKTPVGKILRRELRNTQKS